MTRTTYVRINGVLNRTRSTEARTFRFREDEPERTIWFSYTYPLRIARMWRWRRRIRRNAR